MTRRMRAAGVVKAEMGGRESRGSRTAALGGNTGAAVGIGVGAVLGGRYALKQVIATGGMGAIFRGHDRLLERPVAVKTLHPHLAATSEAERFLREGRTVAALAHPNLVTIYDMGSHPDGSAEGEGLPYLVMEYIEGESLARIIERAAPLAPAVGLPLAVQLCRGLAYAHEWGVVHRDIKPQNVLVTPAGQVKIVDFGIARGPAAHGLTEPGWVLGTAHYLAPEVAAGQPAGAAADLYSVGVVLYRLFTGRLPFDGDDPLAVAMLHRTAAPPRPSEVYPDLPPALEAVLLQLLEKDPERRPVSAAAVGAALAGIGRGGGPAITAPDLDEPTVVLPLPAPGADTAPTTVLPAEPLRSPAAARQATEGPPGRRQGQRRTAARGGALLAAALLLAAGVGLWQQSGRASDGATRRMFGGAAEGVFGAVLPTTAPSPGASATAGRAATGTPPSGQVQGAVAALLREVEGAAGEAPSSGEMDQLRQRAAALAQAAHQGRERPHEAADKVTEVRSKIGDLVRRGELSLPVAERLEGQLRALAGALDQQTAGAGGPPGGSR